MLNCLVAVWKSVFESLETLKLMPGYEDAIEALKKQMIEKNEELKKAEQNGTIKQDTK